MMNPLDFAGLHPVVAKKMTPMVEELLKTHATNMHSFHVVGSAVLPDYDEKISDINSVVVLNSMDLGFITFLAPLGKKYGKQRIAAPLVMTPEYISSSLDAFPIEFLDFSLIHKTVYGADILRDLQLDRSNLRLQCEREIKTKLIHLRQGYISSLGKKELLSAVLVRSITGSMALFRAVISLLGKESPVMRVDVVHLIGSSATIDPTIFGQLLALKANRIKPSEQELHEFFERYYHALEAMGKIIDDLSL